MPYDRIVSLAPSNTEILYALGVQDRIVATTAVCDHPAAAADKPSIGGWTNPDIDAVKQYDPDLVLASDALQDDAVQQCRSAGLHVKHVTPTRFHEVFNSIKAIGEYVDAAENARKLVEEMNTQLQPLVGQADGIRIYCEEWGNPPMAAGNWIPGMINLLGGTTVLDDGERSREVTADEIQAFDPDHIVLHYCGFGDAADPENIGERDGWKQLTAVQQQNVHVIDDALLNRPGPRLLDGMNTVAELIT